mmetsp:Transcript_7318/g.13878  ORF Transcript_7318/g.13878 Transcript_7318/m.13878 type:complete len:492 (+) Transcript_7318:219-1694(+)
MTLCVKVEDVAAALSRAVHTRATMPDYTVSRVAYEGDDEVWLVKPLRDGFHPGECRLGVRDPNLFWPSGRSYSDRKMDAFFKAQRANMCDQMTGALMDILDRFMKCGVDVTVKDQKVEEVRFCSAHLHELDTGFVNPVLKSPDGHATLLLLGLHVYEGRDDEGAIGHSWVGLDVEGGQRWGVDITATQVDVFEYTEDGYPLVVFDNGIFEDGKAVKKGDKRFRGSKASSSSMNQWREDYTATLRELSSKGTADNFFQEMKELRRTIMTAVCPVPAIPEAVSSEVSDTGAKWDDTVYQSMVEDRIETVKKADVDEDDAELSELMKELQSNPFVKVKGAAHVKAEGGDHSLMQKVTDDQAARDRSCLARRAKDDGAKAFKEKHLTKALGHYQTALTLFPPESKEAVACHSNRAQCFLLDGQLNEAIEACQLALKVDPNHGKSRYRMAMAYLRKDLPAKAKAELRRLIRTDPNNNEAHQLLQTILDGAVTHAAT